MYGPAKAFALADRYATECTANGDTSAQSKWAAGVLVIGETVEQVKRFGV